VGYISDIWDDENLSFHARGIYCLIGKFIDKSGKCWPGMDTLVKMSHLSKPTVKKAINELIQVGKLTKVLRKGPTGIDLSPLYYMPDIARGKDVTPRGNENTPRGKDVTGEGQSPFQGRGKDVTPNLTIYNLSKELNPPISPQGELKEQQKRGKIQEEMFDVFWAAYPKKKSKGQAEKAWAKIKPDEQLQNRILKSLEQAKTSAEWTKQGGEFIPHPATWLNAKGWEDEYSSGGQPPPKPPNQKTVALIKKLMG
jgi:hypothetical protein